MSNKQHVIIKGTKDGLTFVLDDLCSFEDLVHELEEKLSSKHYLQNDGRNVRVNVLVGNRYLTEELAEILYKTIQTGKTLLVEMLESNVLTRDESETIRRNSQVHSVTKVIRSGQVLEMEGDLLLIGDVNPGGSLVVTGNIYIMGALRGMAHAGCNGNTEAVVAASIMAPSQIRIAHYIKQEANRTEQKEREMECAYLDNEVNEVLFTSIQQLYKIRPSVSNPL
jgi:septum site-determining protein MinC